jgi:hypothetical protein
MAGEEQKSGELEASGEAEASEQARAVAPAAAAAVEPAAAGEGAAAEATISGGRLWGSRALIALASVLLLVAVLALWVDRVALNTDNWGATTGKVLQNSTVDSALGLYLTDQLYQNVDVAAELRKILPQQVKPLAGPAAAGLREYVQRGATQVLEQPTVQDAVVRASKVAHAQLMVILNGGKGPLVTSGGTVAIDLTPVVQQLGSRAGLSSQINSALGPDAGKIVLLQSSQLKNTQTAVKWLRGVASWLWLVALAVFALAVWLARGRRRQAVRACAIGFLAVAFGLVILRRVIGGQLVDSLVPAASIRPAANEIWLILSERLSNSVVTLSIIGVVALVGAWLAGHGRRAVVTRRALAPYLVERTPAYAVVGVIFLILIAWAPTPAFQDFLMLLVMVGLSVLGIEVLRRQVEREFPDAERADFGALVDRLRPGRRDAGEIAAPQPDAQLERLERLARLRDSGVLSEEEFAAQKQAVLTGA